MPLVVHCWMDLQSVHGFRCCDNIVLNAKCQRVLVLALCVVSICLRTVPFQLETVQGLVGRLETTSCLNGGTVCQSCDDDVGSRVLTVVE